MIRKKFLCICLGLLLAFTAPNTVFAGEYVITDIVYSDSKQAAGDLSKLELDSVWKYATGKGINVALIDGGADLTNSSIKSNIKGVYNASTGSTNWADISADGHGTGCAQILVSVAPDVNLYIIQAGADGYIYGDQVERGLAWAKSKNCRVISMSFGGDTYSQSEYNAINELYTASQNSALVCASAGNSGKQEYHYSASYDNTLSVGAATYNSRSGQYVVIPNGTYNDRMDVVAPGGSTSAAAPFAAGVAALLFQAKPALTAAECRNIINGTALDLGDQGYDYHYGYGLIQPYGAIKKMLGLKSITLSQTELSLTVGKSKKLTYTIEPSQGNDKVTWKSSKPGVASVSSGGKITAKKVGTAVITAETSGGAKATCTVTVNPKAVTGKLSNKDKNGKSLSKRLLCTWKRDPKATGYEVWIATDKNFTKNTAKKIIKKNKTTSCKFSKLKKGKKYYMRIRVFQKSGNATYYSSWKVTPGKTIVR